jgi:hypothetical protein
VQCGVNITLTTGRMPTWQLAKFGECCDRAGWEYTRLCVSCHAPFMPQRRAILRGRGLCCSVSCGSRSSALRRHAVRSQAGAANPNWRGGRASRPYDSYVKSFKARNPEKARAHGLVAAAIRRGDLVRPETCGSCGVACRPHGHHANYSKPLVVSWLCRRCHVLADRLRSEHERKSGARFVQLGKHAANAHVGGEKVVHVSSM